LDHGQAPRDVAQWNASVNPSFNPNVIEVGDLVLIKAPAGLKSAKAVDKKPEGDKLDALPTEATKPEVVAEPGIRLSWPAKGKVSAEFSETTKGIDIAGKVGEPVLASSDGKVVYAGNSLRGYGNLVIIKLDGKNLVTSYAHLEDIILTKGTSVKQGDVVGYVGSTGKVTEPQLNFGIREGKVAKDPAKFVTY
jgi:lipoprotein NlpD